MLYFLSRTNHFGFISFLHFCLLWSRSIWLEALPLGGSREAHIADGSSLSSERLKIHKVPPSCSTSDSNYFREETLQAAQLPVNRSRQEPVWAVIHVWRSLLVMWLTQPWVVWWCGWCSDGFFFFFLVMWLMKLWFLSHLRSLKQLNSLTGSLICTGWD